ncbi:hybrid sensor histidine kinase/response regulator [Rhodopila globiformis]|uniref:hybrid sensor histidine kinase/response regulator n=1 Tax=Rhodopila globiformis TaxID=1071 RepID=UPI001304F576|nr:hybrid sensor histidine kinase/response regulator [Rhodopila globiformis]
MKAVGSAAPGIGHYQKTVGLLRALAAASLVIPVVMLLVGGTITWQNKRQDAWDESAWLVDLLQQSTSKLFETQFLALGEVGMVLDGLDPAAIAARQSQFHDRLQALLRYLPQTRDLFVVRGDGHVAVSGLSYPAHSGFDLSNRDFFDYFRRGGTGLFVSAVRNRVADNRPVFSLAIRRPVPDGHFAGVIATAISPDYFAHLFRSATDIYDDFSGRIISLRRSDGEVLARWPATEPPRAGFDQALAASIAGTRHLTGHFTYLSPTDGEHRDVVWRRFAGAGIVIAASVTHRAITASWFRVILPHLAFDIPAMLGLFSITLLALRRTLQAAAAAQQAEAERQRRQRVEEAARQSQKMEALGQLTGGVAHDFNNLLAVILGSAELARTRPADRAAALLDNIVKAAQRGATLTRQLLSFSRNQVLQPKVLDPYIEIQRMMALLKPSLRGTIDIDLRVASDVWLVELDPSEWDMAVLNIAVNARDAMPEGGRFTMTVDNQRIVPGQLARAPDLRGDFVRMALSDTGPGIAPAVAARAFEPFYTTKEIGRGTGLGLSQVYGFTCQAGGRATIKAGEAGGTTVTLYLPRSTKPIVPPAAAADSPDGTAARRILLVECDNSLARVTTEILTALGHEVVRVDRARDALDQLMQPAGRFNLLLSDIAMPGGLDGLQLARMVRGRMPALPIILVSGCSDPPPAAEDGFRVLQKPLRAEQLGQAIRAELGPYPRIVVDNRRAQAVEG